MTQATATLSTALTPYIDESAFNQNEVLRLNDITLKNGTAVLTLELDTPYQRYYALLRGIFEFRRGSNFSIQYNRSSNQFSVAASAEEAGALKTFIHTVADLLKQELRFKSRLKEVRAFEESYRLEAQRVYQSFF